MSQSRGTSRGKGGGGGTGGFSATNLTELNSLLELSNNLPRVTDTKVQRSLRGIEKEAERLASRQTYDVSNTQIKDLATQAGVDLKSQMQIPAELEMDMTRGDMGPTSAMVGPIGMVDKSVLDTSRARLVSPMPSIGRGAGIGADWNRAVAMDVKKFLRHHHEYIISTTIQECQLLSARNYRRKYSEAVEKEWYKTKESLLKHLGGMGTKGSWAGASSAINTSTLNISSRRERYEPSLLNFSQRKKMMGKEEDEEGGEWNEWNEWNDGDRSNIKERMSGIGGDKNKSIIFGNEDKDVEVDMFASRLNDSAVSFANTSQMVKGEKDERKEKDWKIKMNENIENMMGMMEFETKPMTEQYKTGMENENENEDETIERDIDEKKYDEWELCFAQVIFKIAQSKLSNFPKIRLNPNVNQLASDATSSLSPPSTITIFTNFLETHNFLFNKKKINNTNPISEQERSQFEAIGDIWNCASLMLHEQFMITQKKRVESGRKNIRNYKNNILIRQFEFYNLYFNINEDNYDMKKNNNTINNFTNINDDLKKLRIGLQRYLQNGAIKYHEKLFYERINLEVNAHPQTSQMGGQFSNYSLVCAFVRNRDSNEIYESLNLQARVSVRNVYQDFSSSSHDSLPFFALIFYAIRIGDFDLAIQFASMDDLQGNVIKVALKSIADQISHLEKLCLRNRREKERTIINMGNEEEDIGVEEEEEIMTGMHLVDIYANNPIRLPLKIWKAIDEAYIKRRDKANLEGIDPFEIVIYWLLAKVNDPIYDADIEQWGINHVIDTIEDFIWYKLFTLHDSGNPLPEWIIARNGVSHGGISQYDRQEKANIIEIDSGIEDDRHRYMSVTLKDLQELIITEGPSLAKEQNNPFLYPLWLLQTQQFELAVNALWPDHPLEAAHLGIGLRYYGLLNIIEDRIEIEEINEQSEEEEAEAEEEEEKNKELNQINKSQWQFKKTYKKNLNPNLNPNPNIATLEDIVIRTALHMLPSYPSYCFGYLYMLEDQYLAPHRRKTELLGNKKKNILPSSFSTFEEEREDANLSVNLNVDVDILKSSETMENRKNLKMEKEENLEYIKHSKASQTLIEILSEPIHKYIIPHYLGGIEMNNGIVIKGLIYEYYGEIRTQIIMEQSAQRSLEQGNEYHSILLYLLAGLYQQSCQILLKWLGIHLSDKSIHSKKFYLLDLAQKLIDIDQGGSSMHSFSDYFIQHISPSFQNSLSIAIHLSQFFDYFHKGPSHYDQALDTISKVQLLPIFFPLSSSSSSRPPRTRTQNQIQSQFNPNDDTLDLSISNNFIDPDSAIHPSISDDNNDTNNNNDNDNDLIHNFAFLNNLTATKREQILKPYHDRIRSLAKDLQKHLSHVFLAVMRIIAYKFNSLKRDLHYNPILGIHTLPNSQFLLLLSAQAQQLYLFYGDLLNRSLLVSSLQTNKEMLHLHSQTRLN